MSDEQPLTVDTLYLDAEHFALTAASRPPLEPRATVVPIGRTFPGLMPERPASSEEKTA